jgi:hypothetical protein
MKGDKMKNDGKSLTSDEIIAIFKSKGWEVKEAERKFVKGNIEVGFVLSAIVWYDGKPVPPLPIVTQTKETVEALIRTVEAAKLMTEMKPRDN